LFQKPEGKGPKEETLTESCVSVDRHFKSSELHESKTARGAIRGIELVDAHFGPVSVPRTVDQKIAENSIRKPRGNFWGVGDLLKGQLQVLMDSGI